MALVYPVGSLYFNCAVATNPATLLGFGTWVAYAAGKMIIGLDAGGDTDFDALSDTGGAKTIDVSHTHGGVTGGVQNVTAGTGPAIGANDKTHDHSISSALSSTQSIMNPYVVCYVWKRTV